MCPFGPESHGGRERHVVQTRLAFRRHLVLVHGRQLVQVSTPTGETEDVIQPIPPEQLQRQRNIYRSHQRHRPASVAAVWPLPEASSAGSTAASGLPLFSMDTAAVQLSPDTSSAEVADAPRPLPSVTTYHGYSAGGSGFVHAPPGSGGFPDPDPLLSSANVCLIRARPAEYVSPGHSLSSVSPPFLMGGDWEDMEAQMSPSMLSALPGGAARPGESSPASDPPSSREEAQQPSRPSGYARGLPAASPVEVEDPQPSSRSVGVQADSRVMATVVFASCGGCRGGRCDGGRLFVDPPAARPPGGRPHGDRP